MDWDVGNVYVSNEGPVVSATEYCRDRFANFIRGFQLGRAFPYKFGYFYLIYFIENI